MLGLASSCRPSPMSTTEEKGRQDVVPMGRSIFGQTSLMLATIMVVATSQTSPQNESVNCEATVSFLRVVEVNSMPGLGQSPKGLVINDGQTASAGARRRALATRRQSGSAVVVVS